MWSVFLLLCVSSSSEPEPCTWFPFPAQAAGSEIAAFTGVNDRKSMFSCLYSGCFTITSFFFSLRKFVSIFLFFLFYLKGDLRGISSLSLSHCASVPCRRGEVVSAVWARERQIITLWETGDTAIVLSVCVPVCVCLCESRRILSNLLLVLKWYYLSLFPYQKLVFSRSLSVWDDVFKAV